jgi:hypothetical protein
MHRLLRKGLERLYGGGDWSSMTGVATLLNIASGGPTDTHVKAITGVSTATPSVITVGSTTGWLADHELAFYGVGGVPQMNQTFRLKSVLSGTTFDVKTLDDGLDVVGTGSYTASSGIVVNLSMLDVVGDVNAARVGTDIAIPSKTLTDGNLGCNPLAWAAFTGAFSAAMLSEAVSGDTTDNPIIWVDGRAKVILASAASTSDTTLRISKLDVDLPIGAVLAFSNGISATLSSGASAGARTLAVNAISGGIAAGHEAEPYQTNPGFPGSSSGSTFTLTFANNIITRLGV